MSSLNFIVNCVSIFFQEYVLSIDEEHYCLSGTLVTAAAESAGLKDVLEETRIPKRLRFDLNFVKKRLARDVSTFTDTGYQAGGK